MAERHDDIHDDICDVPGILVGHDTNLEAATGCTVDRLRDAARRGGVDVRGGAPGTRETDLLDPRCMVEVVHAVCAGGSAFGLDAAAGVDALPGGTWRRLRRRRGACADRPGGGALRSGHLAARCPSRRAKRARARRWPPRGSCRAGNVGAGTGATLGKMAGPALAMKGGSAARARLLPDGHVVGALVAVNASGDVYDPESGALVAGARHPDGGWLAQGRQRRASRARHSPAQIRPSPSSPPTRR